MQTNESPQIRRRGPTEDGQAPPPPSTDTAVGAPGPAAGYLAARLPPLLLLLLTGTLSTVIAQHVLDKAGRPEPLPTLLTSPLSSAG